MSERTQVDGGAVVSCRFRGLLRLGRCLTLNGRRTTNNWTQVVYRAIAPGPYCSMQLALRSAIPP